MISLFKGGLDLDNHYHQSVDQGSLSLGVLCVGSHQYFFDLGGLRSTDTTAA